MAADPAMNSRRLMRHLVGAGQRCVIAMRGPMLSIAA
jgi:hypothetical protein